MHRNHRRKCARRTLFNNLPQVDLGTGRGADLQFCGCSSAGRARPRHGQGTSSTLVIRSTSGVSMHSEATRHGVGGPGCARPIDRSARPRAARHHVRRDARVWAQPKWMDLAPVAQPVEQPPCKRQAARSSRRRGHHPPCRVRLVGRGHWAFNPGTRVRSARSAGRSLLRAEGRGRSPSNPARDASSRKPSSSSRFEGGNRPRR